MCDAIPFVTPEMVKDAIGLELGPTAPLVLHQERISSFADVTGDHQWIHIDVDRAGMSSFGSTIAHGFLTLALIPYFAQQLFRLEFGSARMNYGLNKVRFPAPVPVGSALRAKATFVNLEAHPAGYTLTTRYVLEVEGGPKPACVAEMVVLVS